MNYKEIIEDILKTKSKSKLCDELGVSQYYVDKVLKGEEVPNTVKSKIVGLVTQEDKEEDLIELSSDEESFIQGGSIKTFTDKVNRISYLNYVLNSDKAGNNHYWRQILTNNNTQSKKDTDKQLERMVKAILLGKWKLIEGIKSFMIRLPNGYYLTRMFDGSTGWSLVQNGNTVVGASKEELSTKYPEYKDFIVNEKLNISRFNPKHIRFKPAQSKRKDFVIKQHEG